MSYRLQVTVADDVADELERSGQAASRVAATLIDLALNGANGRGRSAGAHASAAPAHGSPPVRQGAATLPSWLEPFAADARRAWRSELWASVLVLCARYPKELASLEATWWRRTSRVEQLAALDAWRSAIDAGCEDPREELCFHAQLADFHDVLEHTPGVGADVFIPGPPPAEWLEPDQR